MSLVRAIEDYGADPSKLILGLPMYGRVFMCDGPVGTMEHGNCTCLEKNFQKRKSRGEAMLRLKNLNGFLTPDSKLDSKAVLNTEPISDSNSLSKSESFAEEAEKLKNRFIALKEIYETTKNGFNSDRKKYKLSNNNINLQNMDLLRLESEMTDLNTQYRLITNKSIDDNFKVDESTFKVLPSFHHLQIGRAHV